jgi:ABC-type transport system involved in multi-copper enzyme maturation permease subunit
MHTAHRHGENFVPVNPIARKDLLSLLRLRSVLCAHLAYLAVLGVILIASWPQEGLLTLAQRGRNDVHLYLMLAQVALLVLIVPACTGTSIAREREQNTLEMLQASRLRIHEFILGKLASSLAYPLMLLLAGMPLLAMLCFRGDLDPWQFAVAFAMVLVTAVVLAQICLAVSACCSSTSTALVVSYLIVLFVAFGVLVPAAILLQSQSGEFAVALQYLRGISPIAAVLSLLRPQPGDFDGSVHSLPTSWILFLVSSGVAIIVSNLILCVRLARREPTQAKPPRERTRLFRLFSIGFRSSAPKPMNSWNPLFTKERRVDVLRSGAWMMRTFYTGLTLSLLLALMSLYGGSEYSDLLGYTAQVITCLQLGLIGLLTPSLTSGAISSEVECGTIELLKLTPLTPGKHFSGKLIPALPTAVLPVIAMLPAFAAVAYVNPAYLISITRICVISLLAVLMCCGVALACSAWIFETSRATTVSYLLIAAIFVLPIFAWIASGSVIDPPLARQLAAISPLVVAINVLPQGDASIAAIREVHLIWMIGVFVLAMLLARVGLQRLLATSGPG